MIPELNRLNSQPRNYSRHFFQSHQVFVGVYYFLQMTQAMSAKISKLYFRRFSDVMPKNTGEGRSMHISVNTSLCSWPSARSMGACRPHGQASGPQRAVAITTQTMRTHLPVRGPMEDEPPPLSARIAWPWHVSHPMRGACGAVQAAPASASLVRSHRLPFQSANVCA